MRLTRTRPARVVAALAVGSAVWVALPAAPARAEPGESCSEISDPMIPTEDATDPSAPLLDLQIPDAQRLVRDLTGKRAGDGVGVAVVDSGVKRVEELGSVQAGRLEEFSSTKKLTWYTGTALAGIIAGKGRVAATPIGIAPAVQLYDLRIFDTGDANAQDGLEPVTTDGLVAGLEALLPLVRDDRVQVINVSVQVVRTPELDKVVKRVTKAGAIIVAAAGDRPTASETSDDSQAYAFGEDFAGEFWPAGYAKRDESSRVVAVTSTTLEGQNFTDALVQSSAIDVAVPTQGAVSFGINGHTCSLVAASSGIAAAEVSGILAMLLTVYRDDSPEQIITRLEDTATGGATFDPDSPDKRVGRGIVQPLEALSRPLPATKRPSLGSTGPVASPAILPEPEPDVLAGTRDNAVWWGLLGGGALLVAVLLRPVLARRRG